jgi:hypothetical protein
MSVRFWPKVDVRGGRRRRPLVMSAFDGGFNWSMQQLVDIARSVSRMKPPPKADTTGNDSAPFRRRSG